MNRPRLATPAIRDVIEISEYIARQDPIAADRWSRKFEATVFLLTNSPGMGASHPDAPPDVRLWPLGQYLIFYRVQNSELTVIRVQHGARDWPKLFQEIEADDDDEA